MRGFEKHLCFALFVALAVIGFVYHEMWADEARAWLVAAHTPAYELVSVLSREVHPLGWYVLLKGAALFSVSAVTIQVVSFLLGVGAFWLLVYRSDIPRLEKWLLSANFFLLYEYTVISRSYALEMFLFFLLCALYPRRWRRLKTYGLLCGLLAQTHVIGVIFGGALWGSLLFEHGRYRQETAREMLKASAIAGGLIIFSLISMLWERDNSFVNLAGLSILDGERVWNSLLFIAKYLVLLTDQGAAVWSGIFFFESERAWLMGVLAVTLVLTALIFWRLRAHPPILFFFAGTSFGLFVLNLLNPYTANARRHLGHFALILIAATWFMHFFIKENKGKNYWAIRIITAALFLCQAYAGLIALSADIQKPFSYGKAVAEYLEKNGYSQYQIIPDSTFFSVSYLVYLNKPFYDPVADRYAHYPTIQNRPGAWEFKNINELPIPGSSDKALRATILKNICRGGEKIILITNYRPEKSFNSDEYDVEEIKRFVGALNPFENYYLHKIIVKAPVTELCP